jgi:pectin methylesterase-like acyl-CoA thioesterase
MTQTLLKKIGIAMACLFLSVVTNYVYAYDVIVAKDGSGNYTTVQAAINAAPTGRTTPYTIFIKNGKYREKDTVPSNKPFIQLIGESVANVVISWDDYSGKAIPGGGTFGTSNSATVTVSAADFAAINITFENTTGEAPQALAINVTGDRAVFKNCRFLGGQDTVFAGGNGARQYFRNCYIDGTVDFIFGDARAIFDSCYVYAKTRASAGASYITAANTKQTEPWGYVFRDCKIPANRGGTAYFLGRPWQNDAATADVAKSYNKTIFLNTVMSSSMQTAGWSTWDAGTDVTKITYAEYKTRKFDGSLVDVSGRVSWSKQLTDPEAATYYNNTNLFSTWDPCAVYAGVCTNGPVEIAVSNFKGVKGSSTSAFTWNISWPLAQIQYEVLRSNDKVTFTPVNSQLAANDTAVNFSYSESVPPPGVTYYYLVRASKAGYATHISDTVTISSTPTINVTGSMGSFIQGVGTPSTSQSYIVSASSLTNNLVITAPANYELSINGGTNWNTSSSPIVLTPDVNGNVANTTVSVRLNATTAGTYNGNIVHSSTGATDVNLAVTGTVQSTPLTVSEILQWWPMTIGNSDSAAIRSAGVTASAPTLNRLYLSNGTTVPSAPAYSPLHGQAFGPTPAGDANWSVPTGPGGTVNRTFYEQFTVTAQSTHSLRLDSLILTTSIYNSANGRFAAVFSKSAFVTDSTEMPGATFPTPVVLNNETAGNTTTLRFAFAGGTGITLASNETLTIRLYYAVGSSSAGRYAKIKDVQVKGLAIANPLLGDYRSHQSGNWNSVNTWDRWDGTTWVYPAPEFPHFSNATGVTTVLNGHTVTHAATFTEGFGYIPKNTKINVGGQVIVNAGVALNVGNNGTPAVATPDLTIDGSLTLFGTMGTNGNVHVIINGTFVNSGTSLNLSNTGDTVTVGPNGIYQHNVNLSNTPLRTTWQPGSTLVVTGITNSQTGFFRNTTKYANIVWNNTGESAYYAVRTTLDSSNVTGSFTVQSTGTTYLSFANSTARTVFQGGYYQTGGTVNFRESGTITDTLQVGGDFNVTGGTFNSNSAAGTSLLIKLTGVNKTINYSQAGATNTNWDVSGSYTLASNLQLPTATFGMNVGGTLNMATYAMSGAGNFTLAAAGILSSGSPLGLNGNITATGTKSLSTAGNYIFNGSAAQVTGALLPATVNALTINNATDVTLTSPLDVTSSLTLSNGHLLLGSNNIVTSSVLSSTSSKYVVTNGTGALKIRNIAAGSNVFPVGPSITAYNPATINNAGTADNFSVSVKNTFDNALPNPAAAVTKQWTINEDVIGGSNVTLSLAWITADQGATFNPASATSIIRYNGAAWAPTPATVTGAGTLASPYVATAAGFTAFSPFGVANDAALPLNLLSFNATYNGKEVVAKWSTANEVNTKEFFVEKSLDGATYASIGRLNALNNASTNNYSFNDASPAKGINYYRLRMVDKDGSIKYSMVVPVNISRKEAITILSNPVKNNLQIMHDAVAVGAVVRIVSPDGKVVFSQQLRAASTQTSINVSSLHSGMYFLVLQSGATTETVTFIK